jgi:small GTP-binding protein
MSTAQYKLKIVMLGDFAVGKTSLVNRYVHSIFNPKYLATLGVNISKKEITLDADGEKRELSFILWDLNGDDGFCTVRSQYLTGAAGAFLVCDVTRADSLKSIAKHEALYRGVNPYGISIVAMNKVDLLGKAEADRMRKENEHHGVPGAAKVFWTSAKEETNVQEAFLAMARLCLAPRGK